MAEKRWQVVCDDWATKPMTLEETRWYLERQKRVTHCQSKHEVVIAGTVKPGSRLEQP